MIVDDIIDTAGTLCKAADELKRMGANSVRACCTHAVLSDPAVQNIHESQIDEVYVTDTIAHPELEHDSKIRVLSMTNLFARMMAKVFLYEPISDEFFN